MKDLKSGRVYISSQNHGYVIKEETIDPDVAEVSFINVNDKTIEGLDYKNKTFEQFSSIQAYPGPQDTAYLFDEFMDRMKGKMPKREDIKKSTCNRMDDRYWTGSRIWLCRNTGL